MRFADATEHCAPSPWIAQLTLPLGDWNVCEELVLGLAACCPRMTTVGVTVREGGGVLVG